MSTAWLINFILLSTHPHHPPLFLRACLVSITQILSHRRSIAETKRFFLHIIWFWICINEIDVDPIVAYIHCARNMLCDKNGPPNITLCLLQAMLRLRPTATAALCSTVWHAEVGFLSVWHPSLPMTTARGAARGRLDSCFPPRMQRGHASPGQPQVIGARYPSLPYPRSLSAASPSTRYYVQDAYRQLVTMAGILGRALARNSRVMMTLSSPVVTQKACYVVGPPRVRISFTVSESESESESETERSRKCR